MAIDARAGTEPATYTAAAALLMLWEHMYRITDMAHPLHRYTTHTFERAVVCGCEVRLDRRAPTPRPLRALHEEIRYKSQAAAA